MGRLAAVVRHVCAGTPPTERLEERLEELQREKNRLQLALGAADGVDVPRSFFRNASLDETAVFFRRNGYWIFEDAVTGQWLERLQHKFMEAAAPARELWEAALADGQAVAPSDIPDLRGQLIHAPGYFDIPRFVEYDDSMLRLLDNPKIMPVLEKVMGGKVQVKQIQGRTVPVAASKNYTKWHRDSAAEISTHPQFSPSIKVFTFPFDVPIDGGVAAVVPGSHRVMQQAPRQGILKSEQTEDPRLMPNHITFPCRAGTAVAYDNRIWHNVRACLPLPLLPLLSFVRL